MDVSSSEIRRRVAAGEPIEDLVPDAVGRFIAEHRLYSQPATHNRSGRWHPILRVPCCHATFNRHRTLVILSRPDDGNSIGVRSR